MSCAHIGRLALLRRGRVTVYLTQWGRCSSKTPHLSPLPLCRGEARKAGVTFLSQKCADCGVVFFLDKDGKVFCSDVHVNGRQSIRKMRAF